MEIWDVVESHKSFDIHSNEGQHLLFKRQYVTNCNVIEKGEPEDKFGIFRLLSTDNNKILFDCYCFGYPNKISWKKDRKISLQTKINVWNYSDDSGQVRFWNVSSSKDGGGFAWCFWIVLGSRLTDRISNNKLNQKCGSILLSTAIIRESLG